MYKIMVRADDLGYSRGVNYGIYDSVKNGIVNNVGLMVNMPSSLHGFNLIKKLNISVGQHTNICVGKPIADPCLIPSLLQDNGKFRTSKMYLKSSSDIVLEEAVVEVEAQYQHFIKITGRSPDYFEGHAILSENFTKALKIVADRHKLLFQDVSFDTNVPVSIAGKIMYMYMDENDSESLFYKMFDMKDIDAYHLLILHPGYLDQDLYEHSSLTKMRMKDAQFSMSEEVKQFILDNNINLYQYKEISIDDDYLRSY